MAIYVDGLKCPGGLQIIYSHLELKTDFSIDKELEI